MVLKEIGKMNNTMDLRAKKVSAIAAMITFFILASCWSMQGCSSASQGASGGSSSSGGVNSASSAEPAQKSTDSSQFTDATTGVSFSTPVGWHREDLNKERQYLRWKALPDDTSLVWITYGNGENLGDTSNYTADDFRGMVSANLDNCTDEKIGKATLGNVEYWKITGSGTKQVQGHTVPMSMTAYMYLHDGVGATFIYYDCRNDPNTSPYYDDFESLVANATYQ